MRKLTVFNSLPISSLITTVLASATKPFGWHWIGTSFCQHPRVIQTFRCGSWATARRMSLICFSPKNSVSSATPRDQLCVVGSAWNRIIYGGLNLSLSLERMVGRCHLLKKPGRLSCHFWLIQEVGMGEFISLLHYLLIDELLCVLCTNSLDRLPNNVAWPLDCIDCVRSRPFSFSARSCNKWSLGRAILLGDAAHVFPPCKD